MAQVPAAHTYAAGDGSTTQFSFTFPYLRRDDVFVEVDGVSQSFTWVAQNTLNITPAPVAGAEVYMYRSTPAARPSYEFQLGAPFLPRYIDENFTQGLYVLHEGLDTIEFTRERMDSVEDRMDSVEEQVENFQIESGYEFLGEHADGPWTLERYNQVVRREGEWYRIGRNATLPYTTQLDWELDAPNLVGVGDATVRADLANPDKGAAMVGYAGGNVSEALDKRIIYVGSVSDLRESSGLSGYVYIQGYYGKGTLGGGKVYLDESDTSSADDGGLVFVDGDGGRWKRPESQEIRASEFGAVGGQDAAASLQAWLSCGRPKKLCDGFYRSDAPLVISESCSIEAVSFEDGIDFSQATPSAVDSATGCLVSSGADKVELPEIDPSTFNSESADQNKVIFISAVPASVVPGTVIHIGDYTDSSWSGHRVDYRAGELCVVKGKTTTNVADDTLVMESALYDVYTPASTTVKAWLNPLKIELSRLKVFGNGESGSGQPAIRLVETFGSKVIDLTIEEVKDRTINVQACLNTSIRGLRTSLYPPASGTSYGITCTNSQSLYVDDCYVHATRHAFTTGGGLPIVNRDVQISGGTYSSDESIPVDFHGNSEYCSVANLSANGGVQLAGDFISINNVDAGQRIDGNVHVSIREALGLNFYIDNVRVNAYTRDSSGVSGQFVSCPLTADTTRGGVLKIKNCTFKSKNPSNPANSIGVAVYNNGSTASGMAVEIIGNTIDFGGIPASVKVNSGSTFDYIDIDGNNVREGAEPYGVATSGVTKNSFGSKVTSAHAGVRRIEVIQSVAGGATHDLVNHTGAGEIFSCSILSDGQGFLEVLIDGIDMPLQVSSNIGVGGLYLYTIPPLKWHKSLVISLENASGSAMNIGGTIYGSKTL